MGEWIIRMLEQKTTGAFNAMGPASRLPMAELLYGIRAITNADVRLTRVETQFLLDRKINPWSDMPIWYPPIGKFKGDGMFSTREAIAAGLTYRPLAATARETLNEFKAAGIAWDSGVRRPGINAAGKSNSSGGGTRAASGSAARSARGPRTRRLSLWIAKVGLCNSHSS